MALPAASGHLVSDLGVLVRRGCKFCCVYADPPGRYDRAPRGAAAHHYATMTVEEIAGLPVSDLAANSCHLHLWTTHSFLFDAKRVMDAWGFEYKGVFVWVKPHHQMGTGYYWRGAAEFLLLGVKGEQTFLDRSIPNWLCLERGDHSEKPERIRSLVERASPGPYLELFGRRLGGVRERDHPRAVRRRRGLPRLRACAEDVVITASPKLGASSKAKLLRFRTLGAAAPIPLAYRVEVES